MRKLASMLPERVKDPLRRVRNIVTSVFYYKKGRFCPVCGRSSRRFHKFGIVRREDAQCVHCGALERHRLLWLFVSTRTDLFDGTAKKMLHAAPEPCLERKFKQSLGDNYLSVDLSNDRAMVKMDVTNIAYPDQSFDVIYCSHVLEHVQDDREAMREFCRVLRSDGWAILLVPITVEETFEDPSIVAPEERLKAFGQSDHVRRYGPDFVDRLCEAGFSVEVTRVEDLVQKDEAIRMGLTAAAGEIYYCTK